MADQVMNDTNKQGPITTSPGGRAVSPDDRDGFANHPHFAGDPSVNDLDRRDITANASEEFGTGSVGIDIGISRSKRLTDRIRANPWMYIGIIGVGGLLLGYLAGRRFSKPSYSSTSFTVGMSAGDSYTAYDE